MRPIGAPSRVNRETLTLTEAQVEIVRTGGAHREVKQVSGFWHL